MRAEELGEKGTRLVGDRGRRAGEPNADAEEEEEEEELAVKAVDEEEVEEEEEAESEVEMPSNICNWGSARTTR